LKKWWARGDSNAGPLPCQGSQINHLQASLLRTKELYDDDLDLKWTAEWVWTFPGPHKDLGGWLHTCFTRAIAWAFRCRRSTTTIIFPIRMSRCRACEKEIAGEEGKRKFVPGVVWERLGRLPAFTRLTRLVV
jgi:hypothetical protein